MSDLTDEQINEWRKCPVHGIPDCSPLLNGCTIPYRIGTLINALATARTERDEARAQVQAVRELHAPFEWSVGYGPVKSCKACRDRGMTEGDALYPCATIRALDGEGGA